MAAKCVEALWHFQDDDYACQSVGCRNCGLWDGGRVYFESDPVKAFKKWYKKKGFAA